MPAKMRIGLVGCGRIAPAHVAAAAGLPSCVITSCAARHLDRAEAFARQWKIPRAYGSMEALLDAEELDLVLLATWPADHLEQIRACCLRGVRAILCEKALAMNAEEGEEIVGLTRQHGVFLMEGLMYRHHPQILKARELLGAQTVGEVGYISGYFCDPITGTPDLDNWRFKPELGGGTLTAKGCYMVDALCFLAGRPPLQAFSHITPSSDGRYEVGHTGTIVFQGGATAQFEANHRTTWREEIRVYGTRGCLVIPHAIVTARQERCLLISTGGKYEAEPTQEQKVELGIHNSYRLQLENVYACLFGSGRPAVTLAESVANLRVTSALLRSAATGQLEQVGGTSGRDG